MQAIMMSIRPYWVMKTLNKDKEIEVRSKFPLGFRGWVYIYCAKGMPNLYLYFRNWLGKYECYPGKDFFDDGFNGKVVARYWVDKEREE